MISWPEDIYCAFVNLDHRTDRLKHMNKELARVGIEADRIRGMLPFEVSAKLPVMRNRTPGAVGCYMSQLKIMKMAGMLDRHALVMEDDLIFCSDFQQRIDRIFNFLHGKPWDVIWLGGTFHSPAFWHPKGPSRMRPDCSAHLGRDCESTDDPRIMRTYGAFSTHAYIVNRVSMDTIMSQLMYHAPDSIGIDWTFIKLQPKLHTYAFVPGCVKQMDNKSDIGDGVTNFSGFAKLNGTIENSAYWWQDRIEDFNPNTYKWK